MSSGRPTECKSKCALTRPVFRAIQNVFRDISHLAKVAVSGYY